MTKVTIFFSVLFVLFFASFSFCDEINPLALQAFEVFNNNHGKTWNAFWDKKRGMGYSVIGYGNGYKGGTYYQKNSLCNSGINYGILSPVKPLLAIPFSENTKISIINFYSSPDVFSPNGDGINDTTYFHMSVGVKHSDALEGSRYNSISAVDKDYLIDWHIKITKDGSDITSLDGTGLIDSNNCIYGINGNSCQWIGYDNVVSWSPRNLIGGAYNYQLITNYVRNINTNNNVNTKLIDTANSGIGTLIIDNTPPVINIESPQPNSAISTQHPFISISFTDATSGYDIRTLKITLDGNDITNNFSINDGNASFQVVQALDEGIHNLRVTLFDYAGDQGVLFSSFAIYMRSDVVEEINSTDSFLSELSDAYGYGKDLSGIYLNSFQDNGIYSIVVFNQEVNGIPVLGGQLKVAVSILKNPQGVIGNYYANAITVSTIPSISGGNAKSIVLTDVNDSSIDQNNISVTLNVHPYILKPVWIVNLYNNLRSSPINLTYIIDGMTGNIVDKISNILYACAPRAFVSAPFNLDNSYAEVSIENIIDPNGCLIGTYADVTNDEFPRLCSPSGDYFREPYISNSLGGQIVNQSDSETDEVTAYYNADRYATILKTDQNFSLSINKPVPTQVSVVANGYPGDNAYAQPFLNNQNVLSNIQIVMGTGTKLIATNTSQGVKYIMGDFTRTPDVIFHEYGHAILFDKGITYPSGIYSAYHEGFADFMATSITNNPYLGQWLFSPYLRSSDNTMKETGTLTSGDSHIWGEVYSGSMWKFRQRLLNIYYNGSINTARNRAEFIALNSPNAIVIKSQPNQSFSEILPSHLLTEIVYAIYRVIVYGEPYIFYNEIRASFASHAVKENQRIAVASLDFGEEKDYDQNSSHIVNVYSGANPAYKIYFAVENTDFDTSRCYISPEQTTSPIAAGFDNDRFAIYDAEFAVFSCLAGVSPGSRVRIFLQVRTYDPGNMNGTLRISNSNAPEQYIFVTKPSGTCSTIPTQNTNDELLSFTFPFLCVFIEIYLLKRKNITNIIT